MHVNNPMALMEAVLSGKNPSEVLTATPESEHSCKRCFGPIAKDGDRWYHLTHGGFMLVRGCRAASFDGKAWNNDLDRRWNAAPQKQ